MRINHIQITSPSALNVEAAVNSPICVLHGHHSDLILDLIRELIGDYGAANDPDRIDDGRFVIHADVQMDAKDFSVCYIRNADYMGDHRIAASFAQNSTLFSHEDTLAFTNLCLKYNRNGSSVMTNTVDVLPCPDKRPIFIYDYFDRLDEGIDVLPILEKLAFSGRQIWIAVCANYPTKKLAHSAVQIVHTKSVEGK